MRVLILGVCGTFMAGIALLAKQKGFEVVGCDENAYPPMSTQLIEQGIEVLTGYEPHYLECKPDAIVIGNAMKRGNLLVEAILNQGLRYYSGPQWLSEWILADRIVLAVAGTHGKTTTSSILAWILEAAGKNPGFLIGGLVNNFGISARLGTSPFFVVEADEYDSAFFDKRSKFIHYHPNTLILNNLEFDHADIFEDLNAIKRQFHHVVRTVPGKGLIISNASDKHLKSVLAEGCWSEQETFGTTDVKATWQAKPLKADGSEFTVMKGGVIQGSVHWGLLGQHNMENAMAAIAAACHAGVAATDAVKALCDFKGNKRRLEIKGIVNNVTVYDDFAHHPTAIASTLQGLRAHVGKARIIAVLEFGSYTMRNGVHGDAFVPALREADKALLINRSDAKGDLNTTASIDSERLQVLHSEEEVIREVNKTVKPGDHLIVMSNTGFSNIIPRLLQAIESYTVKV
ncbi:MAG: UDP-N-acetylmuramate:L-alanyl-gamma-D-glutamyl-meso-diaminopimelate ligase [Gammaproteobacteria bacterium]|jgi:UDP-N-acetylmuramate: L-alanyl-gamma-D-glutamyl-meso-diaminopimelate ligase|nr:UDP-N-acetylmuramate:L-alanyl-gamma-D-glutamyl-meso-diaminopimelate ligase [Gammaproteobacteria bacterium]